ncbi:MAG: response regulator [Deltaproteobacteria bacterium]|nr:response regulator [Deltaproteobacteria bacterium]
MVENKKKVLVLDDEPAITRIINRMLSMHNFEVRELNDPLKLEDHLLFADFDLIITDFNMPNRNGLEVLGIIKQTKPNIPVIILTGKGTIETAIESMKLGAAEFLAKPIQTEKLIEAVKKHSHSDVVMTTKMKNFLARNISNKTLAPIQIDKISLNEEIVSTDTIPAGFVEVEFEGIIPGEKVPFDIYIQIYNKSEKKYYLRCLCKTGAEYTAGLRNILYKRKLATVYILENDYRTYFHHYTKIKNLPHFQDTLIKDKKQLVLYGKAIEAITDILSQPLEETKIKEASYLVNDIFKTMVKDPDTFHDMYRLFKQDTSIFNHSANVCLLATSFGLYLGLSEEYLKILGMGALFHDIGLTKIRQSILDKQTPLTNSEWAEIKDHPNFGVAILKSSLLFSQHSLRIVAEHHENSNGSGYPKGLRANQISTLSRFIHMIDKFDSMTTKKPYRAAFTASQALKQIFIEETNPKQKILVQKFIHFLSGKKSNSSPSIRKAITSSTSN